MRSYLGRYVDIRVDRPLGSLHPKHNFYYLLNYGYVTNTISGDGEEIDVYIIGEFEPLREYKGYVVAVIERENDIEDKLVVSKEINKYSRQQIETLVEFQERFFKYKIIMKSDIK